MHGTLLSVIKEKLNNMVNLRFPLAQANHVVRCVCMTETVIGWLLPHCRLRPRTVNVEQSSD